MGWATIASSQSAPTSLMANENFIKTVEWDMLDKSKFFPMSMASKCVFAYMHNHNQSGLCVCVRAAAVCTRQCLCSRYERAADQA